MGRCILLTSHCSEDRLAMHQAVVRQWLAHSTLDVFLVDSHGSGIQAPDILGHPRYTQHVFSQEACLGRAACARQLAGLGPSQLEARSIVEIMRLPRLHTYEYIFKITCKYYFDNHAPLHAPYRHALVYQQRHARLWQHSEILGAHPAALVRLMRTLPPRFLMERHLAAAQARAGGGFHRLPRLALRTAHRRANGTTLAWL